jgi:hypothetical protein
MNTSSDTWLDCAACRDALPEYAANICGPKTRLQVAAHLNGCPSCRYVAQQWAEIVSVVRQPQPGDELPPGALSRVLARVFEQHISDRSSDPIGLRAGESKKATGPNVVIPSSTPPGRLVHTWRRRTSALGSLVAVLIVALLAGLLFSHGPAHSASGGHSDTSALPLSPTELHGLDLRGVTLVSSGEGWAVGGTTPDPTYDVRTAHTPYSTPVLLQFVHGHWYRVHAPAGLSGSLRLEAISMLSPTEGWAVGGSLYPPSVDALPMGYLLHYHNGSWRVDTVVQNARLTGLAVLSSVNGWAVGDFNSVTGEAEVLHFDGNMWQPVSDGMLRGLTLTAVGGASTGDTWVAGIREVGVTGPDGLSAPIVLHFDGARWTQQPIRTDGSSRGLSIADLAMASSTDGWAVGTVAATTGAGGDRMPPQSPSAVVLRFEAGIWTQVARYVAPSRALQFALYAVSVTAGGEGWAVGTSGLRVRIHDGRITPDSVPSSAGAQPDLWGVTVLSTGNAWAAGDSGRLLYLTSAGWRVYSA